MYRKLLYHWLLLAAGVLGIIGLTGWHLYEVRASARAGQERWISRMSDMAVAKRQSLIQWIDHFSIEQSTFRDIVNSRPGVRALFLIDQKKRISDSWVRSSVGDSL